MAKTVTSQLDKLNAQHARLNAAMMTLNQNIELGDDIEGNEIASWNRNFGVMIQNAQDETAIVETHLEGLEKAVDAARSVAK